MKRETLSFHAAIRPFTFTYICESKRSWYSQGSEHKPGTRPEKFSAIKQHAETTDHDIRPKYVEIKEKKHT